MQRYRKLFVLSILFVASLGFALTARAVDTASESFVLKVTQRQLRSNYTAVYPGFDFKMSVSSRSISNQDVQITIKKVDVSTLPAAPAGWERVSDVWVYDVLRDNPRSNQPIIFSPGLNFMIRYNNTDYYAKKIYYWDGRKQKWIGLASTTDTNEHYVRAYFHLPYAQLAVFENKNILEGVASWYRDSKHPTGAAANIYALGTKLRVTNLANNKSVNVTVTSKGPYGKGRVIDLVLPSFKKIEASWKGLAQVRVTPLSQVKVLGAETSTSQPNAPKLKAQAAIAINEKTGQVLFEKNAQAVLPIASLTKLMTAVIFWETHTSMDKVVSYTAADNAIGAKLYVKPGETMRVKDLYYSSLVGSANNATKALARSTGLTMEQFVQRMNDKAVAWGLANTHFADVAGLDPATVSTAADYAVIATRALRDMRLLQATTSSTYSFKTINTGQAHTITNKNKMIGQKWYITGMKTGYLDEAGYCLMVKARRSKTSSPDIITIVLGEANDMIRYTETNTLIAYALSVL